MTVDSDPLVGSLRNLTEFTTSVFDLTTGNELVLIELMFYLADKNLIDKKELSDQLAHAADRYETFMKLGGDSAEQMLTPMRRVAQALRESGDISGEHEND